MAKDEEYDLRVSEDDRDVAYLRLPGHPGTVPGVVKRTVSLRELIGEYSGPEIHLDFDEENRIIGIELLG